LPTNGSGGTVSALADHVPMAAAPTLAGAKQWQHWAHGAPVVVRDNLRAGTLVERCRIAGIRESFYAITPSRRYPNPLLRDLLRGGPLRLGTGRAISTIAGR
jgi:hypothetical protein